MRWFRLPSCLCLLMCEMYITVLVPVTYISVTGVTSRLPLCSVSVFVENNGQIPLRKHCIGMVRLRMEACRGNREGTKRATKRIPSSVKLENATKLRKLKLPTLVYRHLRWDMINVHKYLYKIYDTETRILSLEQSDQRRGHQMKLKDTTIQILQYQAFLFHPMSSRMVE